MPHTQKFFPADELVLVHSGEDYFARLLTLIGEARERIHLHSYIFHPDATGRQVARALVQASVRGVEVSILLDSFGSARLRSSALLRLMKREGITVRFFSPVYITSGFRAGRRLHHKIFVADGNAALIGGINVSDDYRGTRTNKAWLDYAVLVRGDLCRQLVVICSQLENNRYYGQRKFYPDETVTDKPMVRFRQSDYLRNKRQVAASYSQAIRQAQREIVIVNAYFLPGTKLRHLLEEAVKRGVQIHLMLSAASDVPLVKPAMNYYYDWLVRNKVLIHEYMPTNVHAKAAVFDDDLAMVGSYNLNYLSEYLSVEMSVDVRDTSFVAAFKNELTTLMQTECTPIDAEALKKRFWTNRAVNYLSYRLLSLTQRVMNMLTRKDRVNQLE